MNKQYPTIKEMTSRWRFILSMTIIFALIAFIVSTLMPTKYQSDISVIVVQEQTSDKVDAFSATKSAEFLSNIFTRVIYTTSFFNAVQNAPFAVEHDFSRDPEEREKEWAKMVSVKKVNNTGIINISVYNPSRKTAEETAKAIAYILTTKGNEYHGGGNRVSVRLIDGPNTPLHPTVPHIGVNTVVGGFFGFVIALLLIYFFPEKFIHTWRTEKVKTNEVKNTCDMGSEDYTEAHAVDNHFTYARGAITFEESHGEEELQREKEELHESDPEVEELHKQISNFHKKTQKKGDK